MEEFLKNRVLSFGFKKGKKNQEGHDLNCGIAIGTRKNDLHVQKTQLSINTRQIVSGKYRLKPAIPINKR